jgi:uncharacterized protein (TIGR02118 family)
MIRLVTMLKRKPGTTHEQFLRHWFDVHGPLIADSAAVAYVRRYEQCPTPWPPAGSDRPEPEWDGVTIQEFESVDDFYAHLRVPGLQAEIMADVARFVDTSALQWTLVDEPRIVIGA